MSAKPNKPAFQSVELDPIDARLEAKAAEKGIPTLVNPQYEPAAVPTPISAPRTSTIRKVKRAGDAEEATPRNRMMPLNIEVPDYVWIALKTRAAQDMASLRHFTLKAFRAQGIEIRDADMVEDGRRLRGSKSAQMGN